MFPFLRFWKNVRHGPTTRRAPAKRRPQAQFRPLLEPLEDRLAPATHVWSGAFSSSWSDARNWSQGGSPYGDSAASLVFPASGAARLTSTHDGPLGFTVSGIRLEGNGYTLNGTSIRVQDGAIQDDSRGGSNLVDFQAITFIRTPDRLEPGFNVLPGGTLEVESPLLSVTPIAKRSGGKLILSGGSNYPGGFALESGTLVVGTNLAVGIGTLTIGAGLGRTATIESSRSVTLSNRVMFQGGANSLLVGGDNDLRFIGDVQFTASVQNLTVFGSGSVRFDGIIFGPANLAKTGTGTLTFGGTEANTYTGTTTVSEGTLLLNKPDGINAIHGPLVVGDGVGDPDTAVVSLGAPNQIRDNVAVTVNSDGLLKMNNFNDAVGSLEGDGRVETADPPTLTVGFNNRSTTFAGVISGPGLVVKVGTGTWTLTGDNTYQGGTTVSSGTLLVNGSVVGPVAVSAGGTLGGTGTTGPITLSAGAAVSPGGAATGVQRAQNLAFAAGSSYVAQLNGLAAGTGYDQLDVTGTVNLNGATLNASLGFSPTPGDTFLIVKNDGTDPVAGTFAGLPQGASLRIGGVAFHIYYDRGDGNDVVLVRNVPPTITRPGNQTAFQNVDLALSGVGVADPDNANLTVTLQVSHGTLTLGTVAGLTVGGNGTSALSLSGTQPALNAALAGLIYRAAHNYSGPDTLTVTASDGLDSTSASVTIRVKSLAEQAADLQAQVNALRAAGVLSQLQARILNGWLDLRGNALDVVRVGGFLLTVQLYRDLGILSPGQADALLTAGNVLLTGLRRR